MRIGPDNAEPVFQAWQRKIDHELIRLCGMGVDDLPDYDYREAFDSKRNPESVARSVLKAARDY